ncbi:MAG: biotin--protein ligase [Candidatus Micrarchaeota archaeon]|nr:biotin--protein ligase [Candidatus Micrarchaeota archaeon]
MEGVARHKVSGGKLVTVKVSYSEKIERIQILGDFFLHPESSLSLIEQALIGISASSTSEEIAQKIFDVVKSNSIEMIGVTPESIAQTVLMAVKR